MALTNFELINLCQYYDIELNGVYMKDELDRPREGNYIINLASTGSQGTHWTCLMLNKKLSIYFDSFGADEPVDVIKFIDKFNTKKTIFNNQIIQDLESDVCGYYCVAIFLFMKNHIMMVKDLALKKFLKLFEDDTKLNIEVLKNIFKKYCKKKKIHPLLKRLYLLKK
jgi:hypothetical protein